MKRDLVEFLEEYRQGPAFTVEQLMQIYEASGRSTDLTALKAAAQSLFPDCAAPLYCSPGGSRAFDLGDGVVEKPAYTLSSFLCRSIAIMPDGQVLPY